MEIRVNDTAPVNQTTGTTPVDTGDGSFKVSARSASYVDVAAIAMKYGGGGHVRAAGCSVTGEPEDIVEKFVAEVAEQI